MEFNLYVSFCISCSVLSLFDCLLQGVPLLLILEQGGRNWNLMFCLANPQPKNQVSRHFLWQGDIWACVYKSGQELQELFLCLNPTDFLKELSAYITFWIYAPLSTQNISSCFATLRYPVYTRRLNKEHWYVLFHLKENRKVFIWEWMS